MSLETIRAVRLISCGVLGLALGAAEWEWTVIGLCAFVVLSITTHDLVERAKRGEAS